MSTVGGQEDSLEDRVVAVLAASVEGDLFTYGELAEEAGAPGAARAVGRILAGCGALPWWRVVNHRGRLAPDHEEAQATALRAEGWTVRDDRVVR